MDEYIGQIIIAVSCGLVLLMGSLKRKRERLINFIFRMVIGSVAVFFINGFLSAQGISIAIGINLITVVVSGFLGFPGLAMLYGINLYRLL